jgi:hypothetical protein
MSWIEPATAGRELRFATLDGTRWSAPQVIVAGRDLVANWADFPSILPRGGGRIAVHFLRRSGTGYGVRVVESSDSGRTWSAEVTPHRDGTATEHGFAALWHRDGMLNVAWLDGRRFATSGDQPRMNEMMLMTATVGAGGLLGDEVQLDDRVCDCCQTSVASTIDGPILAYRDRSADEVRDIYVTRYVRGAWTRSVAVHADGWRIDACPVNGPAISASGRRVVVAWMTAPGDAPRVNVAFSDDGGATFASPIRVDGGDPAGRVDATLLPDGSALVTWIERTGATNALVRGRRVQRDGALGPPTTVASSSAANASGFPRMAVTGSDVVFAWTVPGRSSVVRVARGRISEFH